MSSRNNSNTNLCGRLGVIWGEYHEFGELSKVFIQGNQLLQSKRNSWNHYYWGNQIAHKTEAVARNKFKARKAVEKIGSEVRSQTEARRERARQVREVSSGQGWPVWRYMKSVLWVLRSEYIFMLDQNLFIAIMKKKKEREKSAYLNQKLWVGQGCI